MPKNRILNQWQRDNISFLSPIVVAALKAGDWRSTPAGMVCCTNCGRHNISTPIIAYYNYRGEDLRCYACQKLTLKQPTI